MSNTPSTKETLKDTSVPVNASGSLRAEVGLGYGCPEDPEQCTCAIGVVTLNASAGLGSAAAADVGCVLTVQLSSTAVVNGDVVVRVASGSSNVVIPEGSRSRTVRGLTPGVPQTFPLPFTFVGATGSGLIDVALQVGTQSTNMPQMRINVG